MLENIDLSAINPFDWIVLIVLVLYTFWGGYRGVVAQVLSILSWVVAWILTTRYSSYVPGLDSISEPLRGKVSAVLLFVGTLVAFSIAGHFIKGFLSLAGFREFDRQIGALFGLVKGFVVCVIIAFCAVLADKSRETIREAKTGSFFISVLLQIQSHLPESDLTKKFSEATASMQLEKTTLTEKTLDSDVKQLKEYLESKVLTESASSLLKEAEDTEKGIKSKTFQNFETMIQKFGSTFILNEENTSSGREAFPESGISNLTNYETTNSRNYNDVYTSSQTNVRKSDNIYQSTGNSESAISNQTTSYTEDSAIFDQLSTRNSSSDSNFLYGGQENSNSQYINNQYIISSTSDNVATDRDSSNNSNTSESASSRRLKAQTYSIVAPAEY